MTLKDLNPKKLVPTQEQSLNLSRLLDACNLIEHLYSLPLVVNRGLSSIEDQNRINPEHPHDAHVRGAGVDFADPDRKLQAWWILNIPLAEMLGVYFENFQYTPRHVHMQIYPPASGHRFFIP